MKRPLKILTVGMLTACILAFAFLMSREKSRVCSLKIADDTTITIYAEMSWEVTRGYLYETRRDGEVVVPLTYFYYGSSEKGPPGFRVVASEEGNIAGVVRAARPEVLLILYETDSGASFPYQRNDADHLLGEFRRQHSGEDYGLER